MAKRRQRQYYRVLTDNLVSLKKNMKKKWNNVQNKNYVAIPTIIIDFSGHFSGHFLVKWTLFYVHLWCLSRAPKLNFV